MDAMPPCTSNLVLQQTIQLGNATNAVAKTMSQVATCLIVTRTTDDQREFQTVLIAETLSEATHLTPRIGLIAQDAGSDFIWKTANS